ncbi:MAG: Nramp family divalent metal transporter [Marinirhabdus sp.]
MKNPIKNIGPGTLIAAAFIGPGTVTVCTLAGVKFGFTLLWAMLLSIFATVVLQEMAARLGLVHGKGLANTVKQHIRHPVLKWTAVLLILAAILVGNAAYEAGNISGGVLGLQTLVPNTTIALGSWDLNYLSIIIGGIAFALLYVGNYKVIERSLIAMVLVMSVSFLVTAIITAPNMGAVLQGMFAPTVPDNGTFTIIALVGTTVVPYNLFLHASLVKEKWSGVAQLKAARTDLYISILLGGLVSMAIIVCGAAIQGGGVGNAADLAKALEPLFGSFSKYFLGTGLFAAGITSAITAPLAAAYVARGCFGWGTAESGKNKALRSKRFRAVWIIILLLGIIFSSVGIKPITIIQFAQVANGLLLPVIAVFLVWAVNKRSVLGSYKNTLSQNVFGVLIIAATLVLGARSLLKVFGVL